MVAMKQPKFQLTKWSFSMTDQKFAVGGVSKFKSSYKVRFGTQLHRLKGRLEKTDTDIKLLELPGAMTKPEVVAFLKTSELYLNAEYREAIDARDAKYNTAGTVKVKAAAPSLDAIKARAANKEVA
jgi:hypothetical protein